jgi:arylsulfatase A-like enzyme
VIRMPKRYRDGARRIRSSGKPVGNIDLAPTMLDLAGATPCPPTGACRTMDGRSLMPLLTGSGRWPAQRALLTEYQDHAEGRYAPCAFAGIRTKHGIYVEHYRVIDPVTQSCEPTLQVERYDFEDDPYELRSLCRGGLPSTCPAGRRQAELERRLTSLRRCAGVRGRDQRTGGRPYCE